MDSKEREFWIAIVGIVATAICVFTLIVFNNYTQRMKIYVENGYCEVIAPGSSQPVMQKCE